MQIEAVELGVLVAVALDPSCGACGTDSRRWPAGAWSKRSQRVEAQRGLLVLIAATRNANGHVAKRRSTALLTGNQRSLPPIQTCLPAGNLGSVTIQEALPVALARPRALRVCLTL
jgi:hypothetical protein